MYKRFIYLSLGLIAGIVIGLGVGKTSLVSAVFDKLPVDNVAYKAATKILDDKFDGNLDKTKLTESVIAGIVNSANDPYTTYLDKSSAKALDDSLSGELSGIGIEVSIKNGDVVVVAPLDESPAQKAGLKSGDIIVEVDGNSTEGKTLDEVTTTIRGQAGTSVKVGIVRNVDSQDKRLDFDIVRENIKIDSVKVRTQDNIGIVKISRFGDDTATDLRVGLEDLKKTGIDRIIVDLRNNPGGYLNTAVDVISEFQAEGVAVIEKSKHQVSDLKMSVSSGGTMTKARIVVLIDAGSASASEIVAGSLQDTKRATIVGQQSFGKGSVQEIVDFEPTGGKIKVTIAHWFTPNGKSIDKVGITPDISINDDPTTTLDEQLEKAIIEVKK